MKKTVFAALLFVAAFIATQIASAQQFAYNFSKLTQPYVSLSGFTTVTNGKLWNSDTVFTIPLGFNFKMAGTTISQILFSGGNAISASLNPAKQSGFIMLGTGLMDRGTTTGSSRSDIRYSVTGITGSRIFKLEVSNAGFEDEFNNNGELKDSISLQYWLYEGSNVVEFRYGSSMVSNFNDYFGGILRCGYLKNMDTSTATFEKFYLVNGSPAAPTLDSITNFFNSKGLSSMPANGTVFRFTPKSGATGIKQLEAGTLAKVFPTQCTGTLNIEHSNSRSIEYTVINAQGQAVAHGSSSDGRHTIDLNSVTAGVYFIQIFDEDNGIYETQKFIRL